MGYLSLFCIGSKILAQASDFQQQVNSVIRLRLLALLSCLTGLKMPGFARRVQKKMLKQREIVQMSDAARAICYANRFSPTGVPKARYSDIRKLVKKVDGCAPTDAAMCQAAKTYHLEKQKRGRKVGWRKTSKAEDKKIMQVFHKCRPPGCGIDARTLKGKLPKKLGLKAVMQEQTGMLRLPFEMKLP